LESRLRVGIRTDPLPALGCEPHRTATLRYWSVVALGHPSVFVAVLNLRWFELGDLPRASDLVQRICRLMLSR
jgi:hypothetical protein